MPDTETAATMTNVMIAIARHVTGHHDVTPAQVHHTKPLAQRCYPQANPDSVAMVRHVTAYLLRHVAGWKLEEVGAAMGRHHTTIMYSVEKIQYRLGKDPDFRQAIETAILAAAGPCIVFQISASSASIHVDDIIRDMTSN